MRPESGFRNVSSDGVLQEMQVDVQQRPRLGRGRYLPRGVLDMECHPRLSYLRLSRPCEHSTTSRPVADSPGVLPLSATRTGNSKVALPTHPPDTLLTLDRKHCNMGQHDMASFGNMRVKALGHTPKTQPSELTMRASGIQQAATGNRSEATDTRSPSAIITTVIPTNAHPKAEVHLGRHDSCPPGLHLLTTPSDRNYGGSSNDSPNSNAHAAIITHSRVEPRPAKYPRLTGPMLMAPNPWATGSPPPLLIPPLAPGASIARPLPPVTTGVPTMYVQSNPPMWVSAARDPSGKYPQQLVDPTSTPALLNIGPLSVGGSGGDGAGGSGNGDGNGSGGGDGDGGGGSAGNGDTSTRSAGIASGGAVVAAISGGGRTCSSDPQYLLQGTPAGRSMETGPTCGTALAKIIAAVLAETLIVPSIADSIALAATASAGSSAVLGTEAANAAATLAHEATGAVASVAGAPAAVPAAPAVPARVAALPVACGYHSGGANSVGVRLKDQGRGGDGSSDGGSGRGGRAGGGHGSGDDGGDGGRNQVEVAVQASGRNDGSRISGSSSGHGCEYGGGGGSQAPPDADLMAMATDLAAHGRELVSRLVRVQATRQRLIQMEEMLTGQIQQARHMLLSVLDQQQQLVKQLPVQRPEQQPGKTLIQEQLRMRTQPPPPPLQQQQKQQPQQQQQRDENLPNLQLTKPQRKRSQSAELRCQAPQVLKQWRDEGPQLTAATAASIVEAAMEAGAAERALLQPSSEARAAAEMAEDMTTMPMHISQPATRPLATMAAGTSGLSVAGRSSSGGPVVPPPQRVQREQQHQTGPLPEAQQQQPHNVMQQLRQPAQQYLQQPKQQQQSVPGRPKQQQHPLELGDSWQQPQQQEDDIPLFVDCKDFKAYMADEERKSTEAAESLIQLGKLLPLPRLELQQPAAALSSRDVLKQQQPRPSPPQPQQDRQQKSTWSSPSSRRSQQPQQQLSSALPSPAGPAPGTQRPPLLPQAAYHNRQRQQQPRQQPQQWSQRQCPQTQALIAAATVHQSASTAAAAVAAAQLQTNPIVCGVGSPDNCRPGWATKDKRTVVAAGKPAPLCDDVNHDDALPHCPTSSAGAGAVVATAAVGTSSGNLRSTTAMTAASSRGAVAAGPSCTGASGTKWAAKSNEAERVGDASGLPSIARAAVGSEGAAAGDDCSSAGPLVPGAASSGLITCIPTQRHQCPCRMTQQPAAAAFQIMQLARRLMVAQGQQLQQHVTAAVTPEPAAPPLVAPAASHATLDTQQQQKPKLQRREKEREDLQQVGAAARNDDQLAAAGNAGDAATATDDGKRLAACAAPSPMIAPAAPTGGVPAAITAVPEGVGGSIIRTAGQRVRVSSFSSHAALHPGWSTCQQQSQQHQQQQGAKPTANLFCQPPLQSLPPQMLPSPLMTQQHGQPHQQQLLDLQQFQRQEQQQQQQQRVLGPAAVRLPLATQLPGCQVTWLPLPVTHLTIPSPAAPMAPPLVDNSGSPLSPCRKRSRVMGAYF